MVVTKLLLAALGKVARGILFGLVSEKLTVRMVFWLVKQVTDRTDNKWDDQVLVFLKEAYTEGTGKAVERIEAPDEPSAQPSAEKPVQSDPVDPEYILRMNQEEVQHGVR